MRKRKKTATQVAQHLGRADTRPPDRDCAVRLRTPSPPLKPQTKPQRPLPTQLELLLARPEPSVPAQESPLSLPSGLVSMPRIPSRRGNTSDPELALLCPQTRGMEGAGRRKNPWRQSPWGGQIPLPTKRILAPFGSSHLHTGSLLHPSSSLQAPQEHPSS